MSSVRSKFKKKNPPNKCPFVEGVLQSWRIRWGFNSLGTVAIAILGKGPGNFFSTSSTLVFCDFVKTCSHDNDIH